MRCETLSGFLSPFVRPDAIVAIVLPRNTPELYAAQLAVLRSGGAFTCIDPSAPDAYLAQLLGDISAAVILTDSAGKRRSQRFVTDPTPVIDTAELGSSRAIVPANVNSGSSLAYVIYTSGTTGRPKGVLIEHRAIFNLVMGDIAHFGLTIADRIAQCSSPAYDSSIEETWLAFSAGATLVPLDDETVRLGPDLVPWLAREKITVLCPPPTLLRMCGSADPVRDLPDLKLLYVGGEALPTDLANRWSQGRRMENGYGPTECTVTVTRAIVRSGEAVTIGKPIPGCVTYVLNDRLEEVPEGEPGELCVAGKCLARGYHNHDELTREKFPVHPKLGRLYRTGDLVRRNKRGDLEFLGRIDSQVKLRGHRIELMGVEEVLANCVGIFAAACKVQEGKVGQVLVAYLVAIAEPPAVQEIKGALKGILPDHMIPAHFAFVKSLPVTAGGKLDRSALPKIDLVEELGTKKIVAPRDAGELKVAEAFKRALNREASFSVHADFFVDLGGDSLSAVDVICQLRATDSPACAVRDLYEGRTVAGLAGLLGQPTARITSQPSRQESGSRPIFCTTVQCLWIAMQVIVASGTIWSAMSFMLPVLVGDTGLWSALAAIGLAGMLGILAYVPFSIAWTILLKHVLIGCYRPLRTPVWSSFYLRNWIVASASSLIPWSVLQGTPLAAVVLRALGAKVGERVHIHRGVDLRRGGWDLLSIGDDVTLSQDASIRLTELRQSGLVFGSVVIGSGATLDIRAGLGPNSAIEADGYLTAHSSLSPGSTIPAGQCWDGIPAKFVGLAPSRLAPGEGAAMPTWLGFLALLVCNCTRLSGAVLVTFLIATGSLFSATKVSEKANLTWLNEQNVASKFLSISCAAAIAAVVASLVASALVSRLLGRVQTGIFVAGSKDALRIWIKTGIVLSASRWLSGSMLWPWWLRLAGMHIGSRTEISTLIDVVPDTVRIGKDSFFADGIYLCAPRRHRGTVTITQSELGHETFLGNHSVVPSGNVLPRGLFVGVSTVADAGTARPDSAWFGHPPIELPRREVVWTDKALTIEPSPLRFVSRLYWELLRFILPAVPVLIGYAWLFGMNTADGHFGTLTTAFVIAPLLTMASGLLACLAVVVLKWGLLGRVRPGQHGFWSCWCGRWDLLFVAWAFLAAPWIAVFDGTLILNAYLRLMGATLGRRVVLGPRFTQLADPDMLIVADEVTLDCHLQTHSFEDRVLKVDYVRVEKGASVGKDSVLFFGAQIGEGAVVEPHSVVMKREVLEAGTLYEGVPTRPVL